MKTKFLILFFIVIPFLLKAQHNYDNQSVIYSNGAKVGIGISVPDQLLHVYGDGGIILDRNHPSLNFYIRFDRGGSPKWIIHGGTSVGAQFSIARYNGTYQYSDFTIDNSGRVGIGILTPGQLLHVHGDGGVILDRNNPTLSPYIRFDKEGIQKWIIHSGSSAEDNFSIARYFNGVYQFSDFNIDNSGNVGIGIVDPKYKLTVDGTISAKEVKVSNTPNSDYVFEPDYNLLSLTEVETHIKEKNHLPGIPSAEEFKQNGVGLGEMDDMLLRKVEELTLYVIELQKQIKELKKNQ